MPVDALLAAVERDAGAEAAALRAAAQARATAILEQAAADVDRRRAAAMERLEHDRRAMLARETAATTRALVAEVLAARARCLDEVFAGAAARLEALPLEGWSRAIPSLARDTLSYLEGQPAVLRCRAEAQTAVEAAVGARTQVRVSADPAGPPGLLGTREDGRVTIDNTLVGRLARLREDLAIRVTARLEGGE